jgi:O-antigen ligase
MGQDKWPVGLVISIFFVLFFPSHILWTVTTILFIVYTLIYFFRSRSWHLNNRLALSMIVLYAVTVLSGLWAEERSLYTGAIRMKVILLGIPFCFMVLPRWSLVQFRWFSIALLMAVGLSALYVGIHYFQHQQEILTSISLGQPIPVPYKDHIRYAILLNFCLILALFHLDFYRKEDQTLPFLYWSGVSAALFFYIQFLAVKTGMLLSILIFIIFISYKIMEKRLYLKGLLGLFSMLIVLYTAVHYLPTVKNKLSYFLWDIEKYKERNFQNYSDGERIESIHQGIEVIKKHYIIGVGEGQLVSYLSNRDLIGAKLPHNQFIVVWAQNGILGLACMLAIFIVSFSSSYRRRNWLMAAYAMAMLTANMLEPMLETQLGLTLFIIPLLLLDSVDLSKKI